MAMTPRARSTGVSEASLVSAPRSLNELVTWRFSYFTNTSAPVSAESFGAGSTGVRSTWPAMVRRALSISASVTVTVRPLAADEQETQVRSGGKSRMPRLGLYSVRGGASGRVSAGAFRLPGRDGPLRRRSPRPILWRAFARGSNHGRERTAAYWLLGRREAPCLRSGEESRTVRG